MSHHVYSRQVKSCSEWLLVRLLFPIKYWSSQEIKSQEGPSSLKVLTRPVMSGRPNSAAASQEVLTATTERERRQSSYKGRCTWYIHSWWQDCEPLRKRCKTLKPYGSLLQIRTILQIKTRKRECTGKFLPVKMSMTYLCLLPQSKQSCSQNSQVFSDQACTIKKNLL